MEWMHLTFSDQPSNLCSPSTHQWSSTHLCVKLSPFKRLGAYFTAIACISHHPVLDALHNVHCTCTRPLALWTQLFSCSSSKRTLLLRTALLLFLSLHSTTCTQNWSLIPAASPLHPCPHTRHTCVCALCSSPCQRWPLFSSITIRCTPHPSQTSAHFPFALSSHSHSSLHLLQIDLSLGHHFRLISCSTYTAYFADLLFLQSSPTLLSLSWVLYMRRTSP